MDRLDAELLKDVRALRDAVARTQVPGVNHYWSLTLSWGIVVASGYLICSWLGITGRTGLLPWVWPVLLCAVAFPLHWYLGRRVRRHNDEEGRLPRFRRDIAYCWLSIAIIGLLWTVALIVYGEIDAHWYILSFLWSSLYFVGYVMNGVLLSREWFWAAGVMLAALIVAFAAGPGLYWLPGMLTGFTLILAGTLGRRNARRHPAQA